MEGNGPEPLPPPEIVPGNNTTPEITGTVGYDIADTDEDQNEVIHQFLTAAPTEKHDPLDGKWYSKDGNPTMRGTIMGDALLVIDGT